MNGMMLFSIMGGICAVTIVAALFVWITLAWKRSRAPRDFKLLRVPGETLRRQIMALDESLFMFFVLAIFTPILTTTVVTVGVMNLWTKVSWIVLSVAVLVFVGNLMLSSAAVIQVMSRRRNLLLGYLGERAVGEELDALRADGCRIFHDVPAEGVRKKFNIDHVVVGPTGVWAVETKTRRKGKARPGYKEHEVIFDGKVLIWPWGEDRDGLDQAKNEAEWLGKWLNKMTGLTQPPRPILALPGWFVINRARGPISVQNEKNLRSAILGHGARVMSDVQIDLLSRQLENRCRDVED